MKIQKVFAFSATTNQEPRILSHNDYYVEELTIQSLPLWSGRGRFPTAPVFAKKCSKAESYYSSDKEPRFHLYIEEAFLAKLPSRVDLWCWDEFEVFRYYDLEFMQMRVPVPLNEFTPDDHLLAKHILYKLIRNYRRHSLYNLNDYAEAAGFYQGMNMLLQEGRFLLTTETGNYYTYSLVAVPLIGNVHVEVREEVLRKYGLHKESRKIVFNADELKEKL
jgi:hypothetical protein